MEREEVEIALIVGYAQAAEVLKQLVNEHFAIGAAYFGAAEQEAA